MIGVRHRPETIVGDVRAEITQRLAVVTAAAGVLFVWLTLVQWPLPLVKVGLGLATAALGLGARELARRRPAWSRHLLVWGLTALVLLGMWNYTSSWLPFAGLLLVIVGAMLVEGGGVLAAAAVALLAAWLMSRGYRAYELPALVSMLGLAVALTWIGVHSLFSALRWAGEAWRRADRLFDEASARQIELNQTLKSLELANDLQRRTQYELALARKQADEARHMKELFAANISHELRTPLNLILGFTELMHRSPEVYGDLAWPPTLRRDVYQVYSASRHLMEMINDILDLSRFEMTGFTLNREPTQLGPFLEDTMTIVADLFRSHPARLEVDLTPDLPTLEFDRTRIRQVLLNLFSNARRFTESGSVRLETAALDGEVQISVADTGPGIPPDRLRFIFEEFYQVDSSLRRKRDGVGLGLAISKRFIEAHQGRIWVESQPGAGSKFTFSLPLPGRRPVEDAHRDVQLPPATQGSLRPRILVVDPDPRVASLVERHLTGFEVLPVSRVDELAEQITAHRPRAIVCNRPPGAPGNESHLPQMPVPLIECSLPSRMWLVSDLKVGACLYKPITSGELVAELGKLGAPQDALIIDDDRGFVQLVERMLQAETGGYRTRRAYDGEEGLASMRRHRPDVVLLDLIMPGVDGFQVLAEMRSDPTLADIPVILLTATSYKEDRLAHGESQITVKRSDGLRVTEILRCLQALLNIVEPHYDDRAALEDVPRPSVYRSLESESVRFG